MLQIHEVYTLFLGNRALRKNVIYDISGLVFLYFAFFFLSVLVIAFSGVDLTNEYNRVIANLATLALDWEGRASL